MRNGWKWIAFLSALAWWCAMVGGAQAAPTIDSTSIRPHRVLGLGSTADGSTTTVFVATAQVTPGQNEVVNAVQLEVGSHTVTLTLVGPNLYRGAFRGSDPGVGRHSMRLVVFWSNDQGPQQPVVAAFNPNELIVFVNPANVFSRLELWRERTILDDDILSPGVPAQGDPLRPDPLDQLAPDDGSSATRYRFRITYRHPQGVPPQPIFESFSWNSAGAISYQVVRDARVDPDPADDYLPHGRVLFGTGRVNIIEDGSQRHDFGGVYLYINGQPHWMVPIYKFDSGRNPIPLGELTPEDFRNGVVYEYIWEPTNYETSQQDTRYGLNYKYGRPTSNAFAVAARGIYSYEFRAGLDHYPTNTALAATYRPGVSPELPPYQIPSNAHPVITPVLSAGSGVFFHLGTVRRAAGDTTVFYDPDLSLPQGPFHPQPGPEFPRTLTLPRTPSFPVAMGTEDTVFEFRVRYHGERDPVYIKVFISNDFTGESYPIQLTMQPLNPAQTNPGIYVARTRLSRGPHTYYFEANDGVRIARFPVRPVDDTVLPANDLHPRGRNFFMGPFVNSKPILSEYSVTPATGKQGTNYTFRVKYTDPNNQRPIRARLHIQISDDPAPRGTWVTVNMVRESPEDVPFTDGVVYRFDTSTDPSIVLQPGTRHYYFEFVDNWGDPFDPNTLLRGETVLLPANATTDPDDDANKVVVENTIAGPIVVANVPPYLVKPETVVGTDVTWTPQPTDVGGDFLASDEFRNTATAFTFRTKYVDKNNDAPTFMKVQYRITSDPGRLFERDLSIAPGSGTLHSDGVVYQVTGVKLPVGQSEFRFTASDGTETVTTGWQQGPNVVANTAPQLQAPEAGTVAPAVGDQGTRFTFRVVYKDTEGQAPIAANGGFIRVWIDGTEYDMTPVGASPDYVNGAVFEYATTLGAEPAVHQYYFVASDGGNAVRLPQTGTFTGPSVNDFGKLSNPRVTITPAGNTEPRGRSDAAYTFQITFTNPSGTPPAGENWTGVPPTRVIEVLVDGTVYELTARQPANPTRDDFINGVTYSVTLNAPTAPLTPGQHTFQFRFKGGERLTAARTVSVNRKPQLSNPRVTVDGSTAVQEVSRVARPIFLVTYRDEDNDAPEFVRLTITNADTGEVVVSNATMTRQGTTEFSRGATYQHQRTEPLPLGRYTYRVTAQDATPFREDSNEVTGDFRVANLAPQLTEGTVVPVRGSARAAFRYSVKYTDPEGDRPNFVRVVVLLGGAEIGRLDLSSSDTSYAQGVVFSATSESISFEQGRAYTFRFETEDQFGAAAQLEGTGPQTNNPPVLEGAVTPQTGKLSTEFTFRATYSDRDGDDPVAFTGQPGGDVQVVVDGTPYRMERVSGGRDAQGGVSYVYELRLRLGEGSHTFLFRAQDQFDQVATSVQPGPTVNRASITLNAPTGTAVLGQPVTLNGQLTLSGAETVAETVQVVISSPVGAGEVKTVNTAADGSFSVQFTPGVAGPWSAYASWAGSEDYDGVSSSVVTVTVSGASFTIPAGVKMVSIPLIPPSSDPDFLFGFNTATVNLIRWSPVEGRYLTAGNVRAEAGAAYWVRSGSDIQVNPTGTLADQTQPYAIPLARGWNMIGSVYLLPTQLGAAQVRAGGQVLSLSEAARRGLIRDYAWRYDPANRAYRQVSAGESLQPYEGYWIRALADVELILNPPGSRAADLNPVTRSAKMSGSDWNVQLVARAGQVVDSDNYIGVSSENQQVEKPAPLEGYVHLQLQSPEGGAPLAVDVRRSAGTKQVYTFEVLTDLPNTPVTLSWPNLAKVGRHLEMVLVDVDANVRRTMTATPSYTYQSGANGGTRRFQIVVQPRVRTAPVISNVRVAQTRSSGSTQVQISYMLSGEASVAVQITDATGKPVRALQAGQATGRGVSSITWDGRNGAGIAVPAGAYMVRITATTEDGQTASVVQPVVLTR